MARHGGKVLADQLALRGVRRVFSVPGESFLAALDGLFDSGIANVVCRQEGGAAMMAEAYGKLTGQPGVVCHPRARGHECQRGAAYRPARFSTPMVLFVGQIDTAHRDREAFQEVDYRAFFGPLVKWVAEVDQTDRLPEYIHRAFDVAQSGPPGPVVLALPEDMLSRADRCARSRDPDDSPCPTGGRGRARRSDGWPGPSVRLVVVGGPHWSAEAAADLARFAATQGVPVAVRVPPAGLPRQPPSLLCGRSQRRDQSGAGARVREADRLLVLGSRLGDIETQGYTLVDPQAQTISGCSTSTRMRTRPGLVGPRMAIVTARADRFIAGSGRDPPPAPVGPRGRQQPAPITTLGHAQRKPRRGQAGAGDPLAVRPPAPRCDRHQRAGNYAAWLHRYFTYKQLPDAACADLGVDGLWLSGGGLGLARISRAHGGLPCRGRVHSR
jgi:acetolactate synthase I/II/III large subunit